MTNVSNVLEILPSEQGYSVQVQYGGSETAYYKFDSDFRLLGVQAGTHLMKAYDDLLRFQRSLPRCARSRVLDGDRGKGIIEA
jgi:hypothetical protein